MTLSKVEQAVRIERRRKKRAPRGHKNEALFRLKQAVTLALEAAALDAGNGGRGRRNRRVATSIPSPPATQEGL